VGVGVVGFPTLSVRGAGGAKVVFTSGSGSVLTHFVDAVKVVTPNYRCQGTCILSFVVLYY